jgi:aminoglycoside phosphotransferase (APT) family kinase protein
MLRPADRAVVARDPALPGLALLLDGNALASRLEGALGLRLAPGYLRYKVGTSCTVGLVGPGRSVGEAFAAVAYPRERYGEVRRRPDWQGAATFLDDACVAVIPARLDRGLKALRRIAVPERRAKLLRRLIGEGAAVPPDEPRVLRYKPGRRLVLCLAAGGTPVASLKTTGLEDFTQSLLGATAGAVLGAAPLVGASPRQHIHVTGWIGGLPLCPALAGELPGPDALAATGAALARLHAAPPLRPFPADRRGERRTLAGIVADLGRLDARLAAEAERLLPRIAEALGRDPAPCFLHGDFSADQVILRDGAPVIIDYDAAGTGDPARDNGSFLARLDAQAIDGIIPAESVEAAAAAFAAGYSEAAGSAPAAAGQHARALVMLATEGFRTRHPDWPVRTAALLARAASVLAHPRVHPAADPNLPHLVAALDTRRVLPALAAALGTVPGDVARCEARLLRHKPGRRALVRYVIELADGRREALLGKLRAKAPDRHTARIHDTLRVAGLDGAGPASVGVPPARGRIDDLHLWLQEEVPGTPLGSLLAPGADPGPLARTGAALARLHATPPATTRRWTLADEADVLDGALRRTAERLRGANLPQEARPGEYARDISKTLSAIAREARARLAALAPAPSRGLHRDFYFDQVLVDGARIWLVDFDLHARGDAAIDIGNFLAHLDELGLRRYGGADALAPQAEAFLAGYAAVAELPEAPRVATLRAVSLARHIFLSTRFADRRHTTRALVAQAAAAFASPEPLERSVP